MPPPRVRVWGGGDGTLTSGWDCWGAGPAGARGGQDGSCSPGLAGSEPGARASTGGGGKVAGGWREGGGKASVGLCASASHGARERERTRTALHTRGHVKWRGAHVFLLRTVRRSRAPPWHGLGEPGFGDVALDPERGVCRHRLPARQAAVQEPPSVHGNGAGGALFPFPGPGLSGRRPWAPLLRRLGPEPPGPFLLLSHRTRPCTWPPTHCPLPCQPTRRPPPRLLGLTFDPTSTGHSPHIA